MPSETRLGSGTRARVARVLIVDDDSTVAEMLRRFLSDEFDVTATTRPSEAARWLTSGNWYDIVLCDVVMPEMTGVELHERVHQVRPDLAARIVFVTGGITRADLRAALDGLPNLVLQKPFDLASLRELVHRRVRSEPGALPATGA
jgi:CheY-like chemotaxis protein